MNAAPAMWAWNQTSPAQQPFWGLKAATAQQSEELRRPPISKPLRVPYRFDSICDERSREASFSSWPVSVGAAAVELSAACPCWQHAGPSHSCDMVVIMLCFDFSDLSSSSCGLSPSPVELHSNWGRYGNPGQHQAGASATEIRHGKVQQKQRAAW